MRRTLNTRNVFRDAFSPLRKTPTVTGGVFYSGLSDKGEPLVETEFCFTSKGAIRAPTIARWPLFQTYHKSDVTAILHFQRKCLIELR